MLAGGEGQDKPAAWLRLLAALYYCGASMLVQSVNKARLACRAARTLLCRRQTEACSQALFTTLGFHFPLLVAFLQMLVIAPVCYAVARPRLSWDVTQAVLPLALVNVLNVVCGLVGAPSTYKQGSPAGSQLCGRVCVCVCVCVCVLEAF